MPQGITFQVNYDALGQISAFFEQMSEDIEATIARLKRASETMLQESAGDWADAYIADMDEQVLPRMLRLQMALNAAARTTHDISARVAEAEDRAAGVFQGDGVTADGRPIILITNPNRIGGAGTGTTPAGWYKPGETDSNNRTYTQISNDYDAINTHLNKKPGEVGKVRFFNAAEDVTDRTNLGALGNWSWKSGNLSVLMGDSVSDKGLESMRGLSHHLYKMVNLPQAMRLEGLAEGAPLPSPDGSGATFKTAFEHDLRMVEVEQGEVQGYLTKHIAEGNISDSDVKSMTHAINWSPSSANNWASVAQGGRDLNFTSLEDRMALGKAIMFQQHGKTQAEYLEYMKSQKAK